MQINILGWKADGLRCPDHEVNFSANREAKPINLMCMPNGTGKTTIIELIEAALTGNAEEFDKNKIKQFQNKSRSDGSFVLRMSLVEEDSKEKIINFTLDFDFKEGTVTNQTLADETRGIENGWNPPAILRPFLVANCIKVFIFF